MRRHRIRFFPLGLLLLSSSFGTAFLFPRPHQFAVRSLPTNREYDIDCYTPPFSQLLPFARRIPSIGVTTSQAAEPSTSRSSNRSRRNDNRQNDRVRPRTNRGRNRPGGSFNRDAGSGVLKLTNPLRIQKIAAQVPPQRSNSERSGRSNGSEEGSPRRQKVASVSDTGPSK